MNCDLAFDLMTDPAGRGSQALEAHLAGCARCRQMQETLAPALDWLDDSLPTEEPEPVPPSLAGYRSAGDSARAPMAVEALEIARDSAASLSVRTVTPGSRVFPAAGTLIRSAALIALGALLAVIIWPQSHPAGPTPKERDCLRRDAAESAMRSTAEFEILASMCARCHDEGGRLFPADRRSGALDRRPFRDMAEIQDAFQRLWPATGLEDGASGILISESMPNTAGAPRSSESPQVVTA